MKNWQFGAVAALILVAGPGVARDKKPPAPSAQIQRLSQCRTLTDNAARLACFDREVGSLLAAAESQDLVIADQEQIKAARKSLFGLHIGELSLFGGGNNKHRGGDEIKSITGKVASIDRLGDGRVIFTLDDGAVWMETEDYRLPGKLVAGGTVTITRASFGTFVAKLEGWQAFKVARQNR